MMLKIATALAMLILQANEPAPLPTAPTQGSLSRYAPGVMERTNEWRHKHGIPAGFDPYTGYDGFVATGYCGDVGEVAIAYLTIEGVESGPYRFYVSDCASNPATLGWMAREQIAGELDFETWQRLGIVDGRGAWMEYEIEDNT